MKFKKQNDKMSDSIQKENRVFPFVPRCSTIKFFKLIILNFQICSLFPLFFFQGKVLCFYFSEDENNPRFGSRDHD